MKRLVLLGLILVLLVACGYRPVDTGTSWVGGELRILYVEPFANRTHQPLLENILSDQLNTELMRSRVIELRQNSDQAELSLRGVIDGFSSQAVAYDVGDRIAEYRVVISCQVRLIANRDGAVLWQDRLSRSETYAASSDKSLQLDGQDLAIRAVAGRLANDLSSRLHNAF
ncbi:MAG: hypothetical protein C0614_03685 [Desulfuromonas sp.]|nr:MAG: hypothetical protein C0614_03685 [Desulfuromonas sp.]